MKEQRINITINEDGSLDLKTDGIKGEACLSEVEEILSELADIKEVKKTDEYYQKVNVSQKNINIQKQPQARLWQGEKMSCLVKTTTPFISQEILLEALEKCGYNYEIKNDKIYIPSLHKYRNTYFKFVNGKYILNHDSWNNDISSFLIKVEKSYNNVYEIKLKEEAERLERERLAYIESQKKAIMEKAKAKGYRVMETKKDNKIQLTLVREVR